MCRGRAALRFFGVDSIVNDAGTRPSKLILTRISRADKGYSPVVSAFLCLIRYPALVANENLAGRPLPVRALRKGLTQAFNQRRSTRANASRSRSATGKAEFGRVLCTCDHDKSAASGNRKDKIATAAHASGSRGTEHLFLARHSGCYFGSGGTRKGRWRLYSVRQLKGVLGRIAVVFRFVSA